MKSSKIAFCMIACLLCSCTSLTHEGTKFSAVGGRGVIKTNGPQGLAFAYDNSKSFRDLMLFLGVAASSGATAYTEAARSSVDKASIAAQTAQHQAAQETARHTVTTGANVVNSANASNAALEVPAAIVTPTGY